MFIKRKTYLADIARIRVSEGRNLEEGLRLDRNERVASYEADIMQKIFGSKKDYFLSVYPESSTLYKKLATFHNIEESQLLLTSGIDGGIKTLLEILTEPGDTIGVASPTYLMYMIYAKLFQLNFAEIKYKEDFSFDFEGFDNFLATKPAIFFLPNPNQPIESAFTKEQLREFAQKTLAAGCLFVIDEAYHMFGCESGIDLIKEFENVVVVRTFSKGFGVPSIRLGYMMSNKDNMNILSKTRFAHESNALSNAVAEYLLDNYQLVEKYNKQVVDSRETIKPILADLGIKTHGSNGNYLLLDMGSSERAQEFVAYLKEQFIYVKGPWANPWAKYVTITIGPIENMLRFIDAAKKFVSEKSK